MYSRYIVGIAFVLLGTFLFLNRGEDYGIGTVFAYFWPSMFIIPLGLFFHWMYFWITERKYAGLLIPGGILLVTGIVCQISMLFNNWEITWPGFIMAPAIGLLEYYWFGDRNKWLLIPINILMVLSLVFFAVLYLGTFMTKLAGNPLLAVLLILLGLIIIFIPKKKSL